MEEVYGACCGIEDYIGGILFEEPDSAIFLG